MYIYQCVKKTKSKTWGKKEINATVQLVTVKEKEKYKFLDVDL